jgi:hypothetical protein
MPESVDGRLRMAAGDEAATSVRRWYQRTWLWLLLAAVAPPIVFLTLFLSSIVMARAYPGLPTYVLALLPLEAALAFTPAGLLMAGFVSRSDGVRRVFIGLTAIVVALVAWYVSWVLIQDGPVTAKLTIGTVFAVFWGVPPVLLVSFRGRIRPAVLTQAELRRGAWYRRAGAWLTIAVSLGSLIVMVAVIGNALDEILGASVLGFMLAGLVAASLWLATVTAARRWTRWLLGTVATLFLLFGSFGWTGFLQADEREALRGCELIDMESLALYWPARAAGLPPGTETTEIHPTLCARTFKDPRSIPEGLRAQLDGKPPMYVGDLHRILWVGFVVLWVAPPILIVAFRRHLKRDESPVEPIQRHP